MRDWRIPRNVHLNGPPFFPLVRIRLLHFQLPKLLALDVNGSTHAFGFFIVEERATLLSIVRVCRDVGRERDKGVKMVLPTPVIHGSQDLLSRPLWTI